MAHIRTLQQGADGKWRRLGKGERPAKGRPVRYQLRYRDTSNAERCENFARKVDAERRANAVEADKDRGDYLDPRDGKITFADFVAKHYEPKTLAPSTRSRDDSYMRTHVLPAFGKMALASIDHTVCQKFINDLASDKAPATVVKANQIASKVFKAAIKRKAIRYNPMAEVELPTVEDPDDIFLTPAQVEQLADAMASLTVKDRPDERPGERFRALVWLGCYSGGRIGELLALRWTDIDFLRRTVTFERKVIEISGEGLVEGRTKTKAGRRQVTLPRRVIAELEQHQAKFGGGSLVFTGAHGAQVRANQLRQRQWARAVKGAGLDVVELSSGITRGLHFHDMRHTAVSLWVAAGATDMEVANPDLSVRVMR